MADHRLRALAQLWTSSPLWELLCRWQRLEDLLEPLLNFLLHLFLFQCSLTLLHAPLTYSTSCPPSDLQIPRIRVPFLPGPGLRLATAVIQTLIFAVILAELYFMLPKRRIHALTVTLDRIFLIFFFLVNPAVSCRVCMISLKFFFLLLIQIRFLCLSDFGIEFFLTGFLLRREVFIELRRHLLLESLVRQARVLNLPSTDYFGDTDWLRRLDDTFGCHVRNLLTGG